MIQYLCDRCEEVIPKTTRADHLNIIRVTAPQGERNHIVVNEYEFCDTCTRAIQEWVGRGVARVKA